jgi:lysozyme
MTSIGTTSRHTSITARLRNASIDAMTSLAFNIGLDRFNGSTVLKRHRQGNFARAADAFLLWRYINGVPSKGLLNRREAERELYLT